MTAEQIIGIIIFYIIGIGYAKAQKEINEVKGFPKTSFLIDFIAWIMFPMYLIIDIGVTLRVILELITVNMKKLK